MKKIVLASASPRRKQLLKQLGLEFEVVTTDLEERLNPRLKPRHQVEELALQKAEAVASKFADAIIIGADTIVALNDEVIGKPKDVQDAKRILKKLRGRQHTVVTGFVLIDTLAKRTIVKSVETKVWFRKLLPQEISNYIEKEKPLDKAGAYAIQDLGALFIEKIEGDFFGAVGLPLFTLAKELKKLGIEVL
ncbi:septum formation inhibitor Maf [Candidatus Roizmanbacteria bacterium]|nr:septum formation inhibitor Maf [Candidatus Roizmanbacteria bacterium]